MNTCEAIRPTKHALDRFRQRVLPLLPEETRAEYRKNSQMKYLFNRVQLYTENFDQAHDGLMKANVFLNIDGLPPIPLTFVLNPMNNLVITLYIQYGWDVTYKSGEMEWRWSV